MSCLFDYFAECIYHLHYTSIYFVELGCWGIVWWRIRVNSHISKPRHTELLDCVEFGILFSVYGRHSRVFTLIELFLR